MTLKKTMSRFAAFSLALVMACTAAVVSQPSAEAAAVPDDTTSSKYVSAYPISTASRQYTYKNAACTSRGNEWIDGTDLCQIQGYNAQYDTYTIRYSTSSGYKVRYVPRSYFSVSSSLTQVTATQKMTAYIRSSTSSKVFGSVYSGDVIYKGGTSGSMTQIVYKVDSNNTYKLAWVLTSALPSGDSNNNSNNNSNTNTTTTTTGWVKTSGGNLYLRASASSSGRALASMPNGSQVTILQWGSSWSKITYNGTTGYASSTYLTTTKPTDNESAVLNKINSLLATSTYQVGTQYAGPYASEQCKGFAKSIHQQIFGYNIGSTKSKPYNYQISYSSSNTICRGSTTNLSASNLQSIFANGRAGDIIQVRRSHTGSHTMVLLSHNDSGITVVEANLDGKNTISKNTYTWAQLKSANVGLSLYSASAYYVH